MRALLIACALTLAGVGIAEACPDWRARPAFGTISLPEGFTPDPYRRNVTAGGSINLGNCPIPGSGWVARAPDFDIQYQTSGRSTLSVRVESNTDTILLVNDPNGNWHFDDDSGGGLNPRVRIPNARSGLYDIWIGSYERGSGRPARLIITELE